MRHDRMTCSGPIKIHTQPMNINEVLIKDFVEWCTFLDVHRLMIISIKATLRVLYCFISKNIKGIVIPCVHVAFDFTFASECFMLKHFFVQKYAQTILPSLAVVSVAAELAVNCLAACSSPTAFPFSPRPLKECLSAENSATVLKVSSVTQALIMSFKSPYLDRAKWSLHWAYVSESSCTFL